MSATVLPPRMAPELVDRALVLGKRHFWSLLRLALIPFLAATAVVYAYAWQATGVARGAATLVAYVFYGLMEAASILGAWDLLHGLPVDVRKTWSRTWQRALSAPIGFAVKVVLILFGGIALIAPGLYFLAIYFAVPGVNVVENLGFRASFARSRALALGSIPCILLSVGAFWLAAVIVSLVLGRGLTYLGAPPIVRTLVSILWAAIVVPFQAALSALVYLEIRVRKEGYDLQHMLRSLPSAA